MRQFDLEKAKAGAPLVTRDGRKVISFAYLEAPIAYPCAAVIEGYSGFSQFSASGSYYASGCENVADLFLADPPKVKKSGWINIYRNGQTSRVITKEEADMCSKIATTVATIEIHWEEDAP